MQSHLHDLIPRGGASNHAELRDLALMYNLATATQCTHKPLPTLQREQSKMRTCVIWYRGVMPVLLAVVLSCATLGNSMYCKPPV